MGQGHFAVILAGRGQVVAVRRPEPEEDLRRAR